MTEELWDPAEAQHWERLYGPWRSLTPGEVADLMDGFRGPWWLVGGHAIEAFTGIPRPHEDADLGFFGRDIPELRRHFEGRYHLWSVDSGTLRPLTDEHPEPLDYRSQSGSASTQGRPGWSTGCSPPTATGSGSPSATPATSRTSTR